MNRSLFYRIFFSFLLLFAKQGLAQDFPMLHYTNEDGLPSNTIYNIYRDSKGFLWFGSDKGVIRYNGIRFEIFTTFDGLPDNEIFLFKEDHEGRLWLAAYNGTLCYYKDGIFHTAANTPFLRIPNKFSHTYNITLERDSSVTFNFYNSFVSINVYHEKISLFNFVNRQYQSDSDRNKLFYVIYKRKTDKSRYQIIHKNGIIISDTSSNIIKQVDRNFTRHLLFIPSQDNGYFTNNEYIFDHSLDTVHSLKKDIFNDKIVHTYYDDGINRFFATDKGLIINDTIEILKNNNVSSIGQDRNGNYWISTLNTGLYFLRKGFLQSGFFQNQYEQEVKYSRAIKNNLYYVTLDNSLFKFNRKTTCLFDAGKYFKEDHLTKDGAYLIDDEHSGYYYFNKFNIITYNWASKKLLECKYKGESEILGGVKDLVLIDKTIYIKGRSHILKMNFDAFKSSDNVDYKYLSAETSERIYGIAKSSDNVLWYTTVANTNKIINDSIVTNPGFSKPPFKSFIFFEKYIIGYTFDNQLFVLDHTNDHFSVVDSIRQGCVWDRLYVLDTNHVLVSTNNLYRLITFHSSSKQKVSVSIIEDPFIPKQAENISIDSSNCYFFKNGSLTVIPISSFFERIPPPQLYFTFLKTARRAYYINGESEMSYYEAKNITISFSRLVINGQNITEQYSVSKQGHDSWRDVKGGEINLVNPGYGDYEIKIRARTLSSEYSTPVVFTLHILRPYWATWWFVTLLIVWSIATIIFVIRYRINYLLRKSEREHETEVKFIKSEYKALNALMNPHFIFNTLNNVQGLVNKNDKLAANEYLRVFADIIRQNMHNVSKELIPLQKEMDLVVNYLLLEKLRFKDFLNYAINIDEHLDLSEIMVPPLLVQPLIENSVKHGILPQESVDGMILINIYERKRTLYIEVKDNGVGMKESQNKPAGSLHESFGMENIKKRIEQLSIIQNKKIAFYTSEVRDDTGNLKWTVVTISMSIY